jgi:hypothetical protein
MEVVGMAPVCRAVVEYDEGSGARVSGPYGCYRYVAAIGEGMRRNGGKRKKGSAPSPH